VRSAVSARPLRAPWVEMKYSSTDNPSRKEDLIGRGIISPRGLDTSPFMPANLADLLRVAPCTGVHHHVERIEGDRGSVFSIALPTSEFAEVQIRSPSGGARHR